MPVWEQVEAEVTTPHISYAVVGFALLLFGTISLFLKERLFIGEATVATIYGLIVGPHCLSWFTPTTWGNTDYITLEISRIVLTVQIFAVAVELPKKYMLRHWWSVTMLLLPVMTFGWLVTSVFIWKLVPSLRWIDALCIAGCVTATDPVLASAVVGKGKFAERVPTHLRNLLSAESGCNDGMAFPFVIMAVYILMNEHHPAEIAKEFILIGVLYSCVLGIIIGAVIGYGARHLIKFAENKHLIDRESFLVYYFCVALFCSGVGTLCGVDDLLVAFAAGSAFSWDGWFSKQTEESHVSNVIDILLNTAFFVYFGAIIPWPDFNNFEIGIKAWKLVCLAIIVLVIRRIPIMLAIKPITPDIHTWREAMFCGHFGPIGVGAIFMCLLARAEMETHTETPTADLVPEEHDHYFLIRTIWPVTCFLVIASIIIHGSSVAVFTLGKRINNMAVTLTYTTSGNEPSWMSRLPRRSTDGGNILQLQRMETEEPFGFAKRKRKPKRKPSMLRRRKSSGAKSSSADDLRVPDDAGFERPDATDRQENRHHGRNLPKNIQHKISSQQKDRDAGSTLDLHLALNLSDEGHVERTESVAAEKLEGKELSDINVYREGKYIVVEDKQGSYIHKFDIGDGSGHIEGKPHLEIVADRSPEPLDGSESSSTKTGDDTSYETDKDVYEAADISRSSQSMQRPRRRSIPRMARTKSMLELPRGIRARAYMIDDKVFVENEDGDILRRYKYVHRGASPNIKSPASAFMSKVRTTLGFSNKSASVAPEVDEKNFEDVENSPKPMLVPEDAGDVTEHSTSLSVDDERLVRRRLSQMLQTGEIDRRPSTSDQFNGVKIDSRAPTVRSQAIVSDGEDGYETSDYENDDEDAEPETAVERHRRLAALGILPTEHDEDDEEENYTNNDNQGGADEEPKITFMLPDRKHN